MPRAQVSWMNPADDQFLEVLEESNLILSPQVLAVNTGYTRNYVVARLGKLVEGELVEKVDAGLYRITDRGCGYLAGDLDEDQLVL